MRLILIRHAKSSWADPGQGDHARPLNPRGRRAATAVGGWLREKGYVPDLILCSDAQRTKETAAGIVDALGAKPPIHHLAALYHSGPDAMLAAVAEHPATCVALVAHNPGTAILAEILTAQAPDHDGFLRYPTGATTVLDFDGDPAPRAGTCIDFIVPRDLTD